MSEYHKIQTVFLRDPATNHKTLLEGQWSMPEFGYLDEARWVFTEKVDGTNVRVIWDGERVRFGGRTDDAQMQTTLLELLASRFNAERMADVFDSPAILYGEGFGAKIQKGGGRYNPAGCDFILFDVRVGEVWLERENVEDVSDKLQIMSVPVVGEGTLYDGIELARRGFKSSIAVDATLDAEGLVMRPLVELFDRRGRRIIAKIKARDFAPAAQAVAHAD